MSAVATLTRHSQSRRGMALMLVLGLVLIASPIIVLSARQQFTEYRHAHEQRLSVIADDLVRHAEVLSLQWLEEESHTVVLPDDCREPRIEVFAARWPHDTSDAELRITAWDQCGMLPAGNATNLTAPELNTHEPIASLAALHATLAQSEVRVYPTHNSEHPALGALVSTHNPPPPRQSRSNRSRSSRSHASATAMPMLNVNTTPIDRLAESLPSSMLGGLERIIAARREGNSAPVPASATRRDEGAIRFVTQSPSWSLRVDVRVGSVRRANWLVWCRRAGGWALEQRHAIAE